jgi:hypothetical protein
LVPLGSLITAANSFTLSRTIFIPLSSEALSSRVSLFHSSPNNSMDKHNAVVVLPTPAGPANNRCGISLGFFIRFSSEVKISFWLTICSILLGRYFSTHIKLESFVSIVFEDI